MYIIYFMRYFVNIGLLYPILLLNCKNSSFCFRVCNYRQGIFKSPVNFHNSVYSNFFTKDSFNTNQQIAVANKNYRQSRVNYKPKKRKSNHYPKFCLGDYYIFDINFHEDIQSFPKNLSHSLICYLYLLSQCKISIDKFGGLKISKRKFIDNEQIKNSKLKSFEYYFGNTGFDNPFTYQSLSYVKHNSDSYNNHDFDKFIKNLENQPISSYDVADLISDSNSSEVDIDDFNKSLKDYIFNSSDKPTYDSILPVKWVYNPPIRRIQTLFYLKNINNYLNINIKLVPKSKYMFIEPVYFRLASPLLGKQLSSSNDVLKKLINEHQNSISQQDNLNYIDHSSNKEVLQIENNKEEKSDKENKQDELVIQEQSNLSEDQNKDKLNENKENKEQNIVDDEVFKSRKLLSFARSTIARRIWNPFISLHKDRDSNVKFVSIFGLYKFRYNLILKLLATLDSNLSFNKTQSYPSEPPIKCKVDTDTPIDLKLVRVAINSKFKFYIPLLTYIDLKDGKTYLCSNNIPIDANPKFAFPLNSTIYSDFNEFFVPDMYKNTCLFSSKNLDFKDEDILKLLSSYKYFKKFVYNENSEEVENQNKENKEQNIVNDEQNKINKLEEYKENEQDYYYELKYEYGIDPSNKEFQQDLKFEKIENKPKEVNDKEESANELYVGHENKEYKDNENINKEENNSSEELIEVLNKMVNNINSNNRNRNNLQTYLVNEKYKMVYMNNGNAISVNLLLK